MMVYKAQNEIWLSDVVDMKFIIVSRAMHADALLGRPIRHGSVTSD